MAFRFVRWPMEFLALSLAGCLALTPAGPADDGFHAKVAAGCSSEIECRRLADAAHVRFTGCMKEGGRDCSSEGQDQVAADQFVDREERAGLLAAQAASEQRSDATERFREDSRRIGSSCEDIATLERSAKEAKTDEVSHLYRQLALQRRGERALALSKQIDEVTSGHAHFGDSGRGPADDLRAEQKDLQCYDADAAAQRQAAVDAWASAREAAVAKAEADEVACRATPRCQADKLAPALCQAIEERRNAVEGIAAERHNPAGVVDLNLLHDLGEQIQENDATIADLRKQYAATAHVPFSERACRALR